MMSNLDSIFSLAIMLPLAIEVNPAGTPHNIHVIYRGKTGGDVTHQISMSFPQGFSDKNFRVGPSWVKVPIKT